MIACYQTLIRGLLDLTDNIVEDKIVARRRVVRHDGDDAYLVVAADKGTATFSDIANAISEEYGFWLGDAFASGGSAGYDHKKMAITARGAWECVKRHFREIGVGHPERRISRWPASATWRATCSATACCSRRTSAWSPPSIISTFSSTREPDAARSFTERERLFRLPRSSWEDYSKAAISKGGGVYSRSAKSLTLSREAQALLELPAAGRRPTRSSRRS